MSLLPEYDPDDYINERVLELNSSSYPNFGLYHSITEIINTNPEDVLKLSMKEQMQYSDAITRRYAKNEIFKNQQIMGFRIYKLPRNPNVTCIGNMAFMAYHNPDEFQEYYDEMIRIFIYQLGCQK